MDERDFFLTRPRRCPYLPSMTSQLLNEMVSDMTPEEYLSRLASGWRRFGRTIFRPVCRGCSECRSLRIDVERFRPNRSMRRVRAKNEGVIDLTIVEASGLPDPEVLSLYNRYHHEQHQLRGWDGDGEEHPEVFRAAFLDNPLPTEQWEYRIDGRMVGVGYVDVLPGAMSAIYFVYDHEMLDRSPGTWNILCMLERARERAIRHVYLGYFVEECRSLSYKQQFRPNEVFGPDGTWIAFRS